MSTPAIAAIIACTYGALLVLWLVTLPVARRFISKHRPVPPALEIPKRGMTPR